MLAIVDYESGNQTSVWRALQSLGVEAKISADANEILAAQGVIFPGVGAAGQAMTQLKATGLDTVLAQVVKDQIPLLGVCLGCQILLEYSEEDGGTDCLGILPGQAKRFDPNWLDGDEPIRIPHMGWNFAKAKASAPEQAALILQGIDPASQFYFVHSYYPLPAPELALATSSYGLEFASVYGRRGLWAAQFHPEKSGPAGLRLLSNFAAFCAEEKR